MQIGVVLVIALALAFDYSNGFHDAANSIATVVSTRVLSPRWAVIWAAFFNFVAFLVFKTHVANTIAKDVVTQDVLTIGVVFSGLSPLIGLALGLTLTLIIQWTFHRYRKVEKLNRGFRRAQLVSAAAFS